LVGPDTVIAKGGHCDKGGYDDYDFDIKFEEETRWRDIATALDYLVNEGYAIGSNARIETGPLGFPIPVTEGGTPYRIYLQGTAKIKP